MDLDGHYMITRTAIEETRGKLSFFPIATDLAAVYRDLQDVVNGDHDSRAGQRHHFMAYEGEDAETAYDKAMLWILTYATKAAQMYIDSGKGKGSCTGIEDSFFRQSAAGDLLKAGSRGSMILKGQTIVPFAVPAREGEFVFMQCTGAGPLGTAAHAVEDSFAPMHVERGEGGTITKIMVYKGQNHDDHDVEDRLWRKKGTGFFKNELSSDVGRPAVEAVKDLFYLVDAAVRSGRPTLTGWQAYKGKWFQKAFAGKNTPLTSVIPPTAPTVKVPAQLGAVGPLHHVVKSGESLSVIAGHYYGDVLLWPVIYDANRRTVKDPNFIQPGWLLNVPETSSIPDDSRPALRERGLHWRTGH